MKRHAALAIVATATLLLLFAVPALVLAQDDRSLQGVERWEYAELRLFGADAVLQSASGAVYLEGPDLRDAREPIDVEGGSIRVTRSMTVRHLTRVGSRGWELVELSAGEPGVFLLKRRL